MLSYGFIAIYLNRKPWLFDNDDRLIGIVPFGYYIQVLSVDQLMTVHFLIHMFYVI